MLPILLKLGPITIYSYGVFLTLGLLAGLYWYWKMGRDEHWNETKLFDVYFAALIAYFVMGRVGYVIWHPELRDMALALSIFSHPGISVSVGLFFAMLLAWFMSRRNEWESYKFLDLWVVAVATIMVVGSIGALLNGSLPGKEASFLSYVHPGDTVTRISGDLWTFVWAVITFGVVSRVRKNFRFYSWYKRDASVAKDGLAFLTYIMFLGLYATVLGFLIDGGGRVWVFPVLSLTGVLIMICALTVIYLRRGK